MLVDYENPHEAEPKFALQRKSKLPPPYRYSSGELDLDDLCNEVVMRLYRCDIAHIWLGGCKVFVDVVPPKPGDPEYPYGYENSLTIHPSGMPGNGRQQHIRYLVKMWILHDIDEIVTYMADDMLFDLYRYGKCDLSDNVEPFWMQKAGTRNALAGTVVKASEMPVCNQLDWARGVIRKLVGRPELSSGDAGGRAADLERRKYM